MKRQFILLLFLIIAAGTMDVQGQPQIARDLFNGYDSYKVEGITSRRFTQDQLLGWLTPFVENGVVQAESLGTSGEGRTISLYTFGSGPIKVFLWSQMHGDEPTATMALVDMINFFAKNPEHRLTKIVKERLTLLMIPMLNPDGAQRFTRRTAQLIDMNRDAVDLATPEARILKSTRDRFQPEYGFNLHDQDPRYTVGMSRKMTAIALLAPAMNEARTDDSVRLRAKHVAASLAEVLRQFIPANLAKWDDTFEPRAFGDNIQKWGTSTVLIESGGWRNDPNKFFLRKLNAVGIMTTLFAIGTKTVEDADVALYENIQFNMKYGFDLLIRNVVLNYGNGLPPVSGDLGINYEETQAPDGTLQRLPRLMDLGDLSVYTAFEEHDAKGATVDASRMGIERLIPQKDLEMLIAR